MQPLLGDANEPPERKQTSRLSKLLVHKSNHQLLGQQARVVPTEKRRCASSEPCQLAVLPTQCAGPRRQIKWLQLEKSGARATLYADKRTLVQVRMHAGVVPPPPRRPFSSPPSLTSATRSCATCGCRCVTCAC